MAKIITDSGEFIMSPKNDFAFRLLFGDMHYKDLLLDLLNSILSDRIQDLDLMDPHLLRSATEREGVLDIRAKTDTGVQIDVEMQVLRLRALEKRTIFYWARMYADQLFPGQKYHELNRTIAINILDYCSLPVDDLHTCFQAYDKKHDLILSDVFEIHMLELPKLDRVQPQYQNSSLFRWLSFLNSKTVEDLRMAAEGKPIIARAYDALRTMSLDEENRRLYEARELFLSDQATRIYEAKEEGREEGREEVARRLLSLGLEDELVMKASGLDQRIIDSLKKSSPSRIPGPNGIREREGVEGSAANRCKRNLAGMFRRDPSCRP